MNEKPNATTPYLGMNLQDDPSAMEPGEFSFVLNAVEAEGMGDPHVSNAPAADLCLVYPSGYVLLNPGGTRIDNERFVVFLLNRATGDCQIGISTLTAYTQVVKDPSLGFKVQHLIQARIKRSFDGDTYVYWVNNFDPIRVMNLNNPPFIRVPNGTGGFTTTSQLDIDQLAIFKKYDLPEFTVTEILNVGQIKSGGLYICMQYADARGNGLTAWHRTTNKIPIVRDSISDMAEHIVGVKTGLPTNKAVKLTLSGADLSFPSINIGVIRMVDGVPAGFKVSTIQTTETQYIYTGTGIEIPVDLAELIEPATVYQSAKTIDEADGSLIAGNLLGKKKLNLQPYISQIQIRWQTYRVRIDNKEKSHKNPVFAAGFMSARRNEVQPYGLIVEYTDGTDSDAYPLVARAMNRMASGQPFTRNQSQQLQIGVDPIQWDSEMKANQDIYEGTAVPRWKAYNTATIEGNHLFLTAGEGPALYGETGFWESTDRYPNNPAVWGALAGTFIRFPKMPDINLVPITITERTSTGSDTATFVHHLGVVFPNIEQVFASMPPEVKAQIKGWRIVRADRKFNKSVHASGLIFNCFQQEFRLGAGDQPDIRLYPTYPLNDCRPDVYILKRFLSGSNPLNQPRVSNDDRRDDVFTFLSPDTALGRIPLSAAELKVEGEYQGIADCWYEYVSPMAPFKSNGSSDQHTLVQGFAVGRYTEFVASYQDNVRRRLVDSIYVPFDSYVPAGAAGAPLWNRGRESTVMLVLNKTLSNTRQQDRSRFIPTDEDGGLPEEKFDATPGDLRIGHHRNKPCAAYYVSLVSHIPNQYGSLSNLRFVETGFTKARYTQEGMCLGGDTYIGRYADKRQMSHINWDYLQNFRNQDWASGFDSIGQATIPTLRYYYRHIGQGAPVDDIGNVLTMEMSRQNDTLGMLMGFMHGVPYFWTESDINIDLRVEGDLDKEAIFPSLLHGSAKMAKWLNVSNLGDDNTKLLNVDLSGYNDFNYVSNPDPAFEPDKNDQVRYITRAIKSLRSQPEDVTDNWQVFKPLDYYDFSKSRGELVDIRYVGQSRTLFRFERSLYITSLQQMVATSEGQILLGTGRLFAQDPQELSYTELGYGGTRSQWAFNMTEFGAFMVDPDNGKVFNMAQGLQEISAYKANSWFERNLPFLLNRDIPGVPTDNSANPEGIGLHSTWDPKNLMWLLTKKDYQVRDRSLLSQFSYNDGRIYLAGQPVPLSDERLFINCSWTLAFKPKNKRWFTFYSFIPDAYILNGEAVVSSIAGNGTSELHRHDSRTRMHQYYGKSYPFILEFVNKLDGYSEYISNTIAFQCSSYSVGSGRPEHTRLRSFNKAIVSNDHQTSGELGLVLQNENNLYMRNRGLQLTAFSKDVPLRYRHGQWNFSDYCDIALSDSIFTTSWEAPGYRAQYPIDKVLDAVSLDYSTYKRTGPAIRGPWTKTRLILDNANDLKLLFRVGIETVRPSAG